MWVKREDATQQLHNHISASDQICVDLTFIKVWVCGKFCICCKKVCNAGWKNTYTVILLEKTT